LNLRASYGSFSEAFRQAYLTVTSTVTTTGFLTTDYAAWPQYAQSILIVLMFIGACTSSTGGGIKVSRVVIASRYCRQGISRMLHPKAVTSVHLDGKTVDINTIQNVCIFLLCYGSIAFSSVVVLSLDNLDFSSAFAVMVSCFNNSGATTAIMNTSFDYADLSWFSKLVMCFDMLAGRLEIFPMMILFSPAFWKLRKKK
jgi:trk system potassium uptake protein TrkH